MRRESTSARPGILLLVALVALAWWGCSERLVDDSNEMNLQIPLSAELLAAKSMAAADLFRLTVTDEAADSVLALTSLALNQSILEGAVEDLPAGRLLTFLVEAVESASGVVIYQGSATAIVVANRTITLDIPLQPVVPLLRFKPRYVELTTDSSFVLDTWIENVDSLFGISFRVFWHNTLSLRVDSTRPGDDVSSPGIIFFSQAGDSSFYTFSITQTGAGETIVDATGKAHLATTFFTLEDMANAPTNLFDVTVEPTGLTGPDSAVINLEDVYTDDCAVSLGILIIEE